LKKNLPFSLTKDLVELIQNLARDYGSDLHTCQANKSDISKFTLAIGHYLKQRHLDSLSQHPFSIAIDGEGSVEYLGINARFFENEKAVKTTTKLVGLVPFKNGASGDMILKMIQDFLFVGEEGKNRKKNIVGVSCDGAPNMLSSKDGGVTNRLSKEIDSLIVTHDLCHSYNLIIQRCLDEFPAKYQNIVSRLSQNF